MKTAITLCLSFAVLAAVNADKPICLMGTFDDCSSMQYTSDYQTGIYYCCADVSLRPVLDGDLGSPDLTCSCYTDMEYCNENPWEC
ncbi:hypothetical protein RRG08_046141 [Elysia crispata]|uniref:Plethodontid modulating factor n=1 Tax=Elysia crispata TaxID=231223 RepID=A0AAE1A2J5_9GAST|nr:hypothetical protein RRG08_046141 [Elysia crispata]